MKILVVAPAWVGDMVMAHCLVQVLVSRYPGVDVHLLAPVSTQPLGCRMPGVTKSHTLDVAHGELAFRKRRNLGRSLKAEGYDQAIVLPNSFKSALVPFWAGIPKRTGWTGETRIGVLNDRRKLNDDHHPLMIQRFMALGLDGRVHPDKPYPRPALRADVDNAERLRREHALQSAGITVLCPGAEFGPAKRWPPDRFAAVARHAVAAGGEVWLIGSPGDREACAAVARLVPAGLVDLAGKTSLLDAVDLLSLADQVVCNDSGLMHVAAALGRPLVAVFGSSSAEFTPPLGEESRVVSLDLPCRPCFERRCPLGHLDCLLRLTPEQVIARLPVSGP